MLSTVVKQISSLTCLEIAGFSSGHKWFYIVTPFNAFYYIIYALGRLLTKATNMVFCAIYISSVHAFSSFNGKIIITPMYLGIYVSD